MVTIVTRAGKGSELTHEEVDDNFTNLNEVVEIAARRYEVSIGDGASGSFTITHNLGTKNVLIQVYPNTAELGEVYTKFSAATSTTYHAFNVASYAKKLEVQLAFSGGDYVQTDDDFVLSASILNNGDNSFNSFIPTDGVTVVVIG